MNRDFFRKYLDIISEAPEMSAREADMQRRMGATRAAATNVAPGTSQTTTGPAGTMTVSNSGSATINPTRPAPLAQPANTNAQPGANMQQQRQPQQPPQQQQPQQAMNQTTNIQPRGPVTTTAQQPNALPRPGEASSYVGGLVDATAKYPDTSKSIPNGQSKTVNNPMTDFEESADHELNEILRLSGKQKQTTNENESLQKFYSILNESTDTEDFLLNDSFDIELNEHFVIETGIVGFTDDGIIIEADETLLGLLEVNNILCEDETTDQVEEGKPGLWDNIHAKRKRIKSGSGERMREPGSKGAPTAQNFKDAAKEGVEDSGQRARDAFADLESGGKAASDLELEKFRERVRQGEAGKPTKLKDMNPIDRAQWEKEKSQKGIQNEAEYQGRKVPLGKPMAGDVKKSKVYVRKPNGKVVKVNFGDKNMKIKKSNPNRRKSFRARHRCENPGPRWKARYWSCRAW